MLSILCEFVGVECPGSQATYTKISQKLGKCVEILDFACLKGTPILANSTALIAGFVKYFATDLGDSAFELPAPIW